MCPAELMDPTHGGAITRWGDKVRFLGDLSGHAKRWKLSGNLRAPSPCSWRLARADWRSSYAQRLWPWTRGLRHEVQEGGGALLALAQSAAKRTKFVPGVSECWT